MQIDLHIDTSMIITVVIVLVLGGALSACTVLGTGRNTLVLADQPPAGVYSGTEFNHLIIQGDKRLIGLQGKDPRSNEEWTKFASERLGGVANNAATIDINVRDQTNTPALDLFNIETVSAADVTKILTDNRLTPPQKEALLIQLRDNFRGMPETYSRLVSHGADQDGNLVYYYFPQVTIDLTGTLNTAETLDRFDFIAAAIRIPGDVDATFINFSPKAADLFDFTLGQLKQTASAIAKASASNKATTSTTTANKPATGPETGASMGGELNHGGEASFTLTDELTRDMKSSLEARSAGIMQKGKLFLIELRSNEQKRIAGTYTYNVMLEVPSTVVRAQNGATTTWTSTPKATAIQAQVRVVGIVRHVVKPGKTGTFKRVPEPLNDETYRQVVLRDEPVTLWNFTNIPTGQIATETNLTVYSNVEGASFLVVDETTGAVLDHGAGQEVHLALATQNKVKVVFTPAIVGGDKPVALKAPDVTGITPGKKAIAVGSYAP
jgi:hypothetical protein